MKTVKISELPLFQSLKGLFTIGTDDHNRSVKVSLEFVEDAATRANRAAEDADGSASAASEAANAAIRATESLTEASGNAVTAANEAARSAIDATKAANASAANANLSAQATKEATASAITATGNAEKATSDAKAAATAANEAAKTVTGMVGIVEPRIDEIARNSHDIGAILELPQLEDIPLINGQPAILYGSGAPALANVPYNWNQFDPKGNIAGSLEDGTAATGFTWTGEPSGLGQRYVDVSAQPVNVYYAVRANWTDKLDTEFYHLIWKIS